MSDALFDTLAEPSRRHLMQHLLTGPKPVNALVAATGMSQPLVSKHLRVLKEADLVRMSPEGQRRVYRVNAEPLRALDAWLAPYRAFWTERLDALEQHLMETETHHPEGETHHDES